MNRFKVGDRVIRIKGEWMLNFRGTVTGFAVDGELYIDLDPEFKDLAVEDGRWGWNPDRVELEEIYDSPLYEALK